MKNLSLLKVTGIVVIAAFASSFVNADDEIKNVTDAAILKAVPQLAFSELIKKLDTDKNGTLSEKEVSVNNSKLLQQQFKKMDTNKDRQIDEAEYNQYIS